MSKGFSNLFSGTHGSKTSALSNQANKAVKDLINSNHKNKTKSMAVGAFDTKLGTIQAGFAGEIPDKIHPELIKRAEKIGGIGSLGLTDKNTIGVCAEFHVVNQLLLSGSDIKDIHLTAPIRPRTGKVMPYCANCIAMFSDLINKK